MNPRRRSVSVDSRANSNRDAPAEPKVPRIRKREPPEKSIEKFWNKFSSKRPGKVLKVLPNNPFARTATAKVSKDVSQGEKASNKYEQVRDRCIRDVNRIVKECKRTNQKYRDSDFDIEFDLKTGRRFFLDGLCENANGMGPQGVKRVPDIFEKPQFFVDGASALDVRQGGGGDCWLMAALASLAGKDSLIRRICVARDESIGVYGFVFYRDGEWQQCIIDDKLYLISPDFNESLVNRFTQDEWQKNYQTGSRALFFAACSDENETWLPLLEKAYAKAHGDYLSIRGGWTGEAVEDLTGGVTSEIFTNDILDRDLLWREELLKVNNDFLFSASTGHFSGWLMPERPSSSQQQGIQDSHAYSVLDAREVDGFRLLKLRNPWGKVEWTGAWSDGSKEWTLEWMKKLEHKFGDDGVFWISYEDLLKKYSYFTRTRLFDESWHVAQQWTSINVAWSTDYHSTKFSITIDAPETTVVIVLSQLDDRYFQGLRGEYFFRLHFRVERQGHGNEDIEDNDYIVHTHGQNFMDRSVSTDTVLEKGTYDVYVKVFAARDPSVKPTDEVVKRVAALKQEKLIQVGRSYDLAHAKGQEARREMERKRRESKPNKAKTQAPERAKLRKEIEERKKKEWIKTKKAHARQNRAMEKQERVRALREMKRAKGQGRVNGGWEDVRNADRDADHDADADFVDAEQSPRDEEAATEVGQEGNGVVHHFNGEEEDQGPNGDLPIMSRRTSSFPISPTLSDAASFYSFEFDSDLDMPSESELRPRREPMFKGSPPPINGSPPRYPIPPDGFGHGSFGFLNNDDMDGDDQDDRDNNDNRDVLDPWNAVCVVGLRVYSKDEGLSVRVVHPPRPPMTMLPLLDENNNVVPIDSLQPPASLLGDGNKTGLLKITGDENATAGEKNAESREGGNAKLKEEGISQKEGEDKAVVAQREDGEKAEIEVEVEVDKVAETIGNVGLE